MKNTFYIESKNKTHGEMLQKAMFGLGFAWRSGATEPVPYDFRVLVVDVDTKKLGYSDTRDRASDTLNDLLLRLSRGGYREFALNSEYTAVIKNREVTVGCQTFSQETIEGFIKAYQDTMQNL